MSRTPALTPIDEQTFDGMAQMIKAMLPYMDSNTAKTMAIFARFIELQRTIAFFDQPSAIHACGIGTRHPSAEEMLHDLKKYCDGPHADMIDRLLNIIKMGKMYERFKDMENNPMMQTLFKTMSSEFVKAASDDTDSKNTSPAESEAAPSHKDHQSQKGGSKAMNFENGFNPDMLRQLPPELTKNVDMDKFSRLITALKNPSAAPDPSIKTEFEKVQQTLSAVTHLQEEKAPDYEESKPQFNAEQLKSLLTPEQQKMFETLSQTMHLKSEDL